MKYNDLKITDLLIKGAWDIFVLLRGGCECNGDDS
jgi:hypothetical protein